MKVQLIRECCGGGECPAVFKTDRGTYIVQGWKLDSLARESVCPKDGEDAIEIPEALLRDLLRHANV